MSGSAVAVAAVAAGALLCFFGYRLLRVTLGIVGFLAFGLLAAWGAMDLLHASQTVVLVAALCGGIIGTLLAVLLFRFGVFVLGAGGGALLASMIMTQVGRPPALWMLAGVGLAGGVLALLLQRPVVSILTAAGGAALAVAGVFQLLGREQLLHGPARAMPVFGWWMALAWVALGIVGSVVQLVGRRQQEE